MIELLSQQGYQYPQAYPSVNQTTGNLDFLNNTNVFAPTVQQPVMPQQQLFAEQTIAVGQPYAQQSPQAIFAQQTTAIAQPQVQQQSSFVQQPMMIQQPVIQQPTQFAIPASGININNSGTIGGINIGALAQQSQPFAPIQQPVQQPTQNQDSEMLMQLLMLIVSLLSGGNLGNLGNLTSLGSPATTAKTPVNVDQTTVEVIPKY